MKDYRAIIFDFDMTLADTAMVIVTLLNEVAEEFGYPRMPEKRLFPSWDTDTRSCCPM